MKYFKGKDKHCCFLSFLQFWNGKWEVRDTIHCCCCLERGKGLIASSSEDTPLWICPEPPSRKDAPLLLQKSAHASPDSTALFWTVQLHKNERNTDTEWLYISQASWLIMLNTKFHFCQIKRQGRELWQDLYRDSPSFFSPIVFNAWRNNSCPGKIVLNFEYWLVFMQKLQQILNS